MLCSSCKEDKPEAAFNRDSKRGRQRYCIPCSRERKRGRRRSAAARRTSTAAARLWERANPDARRAHNLLYKAKKRGEVVRSLTCEDCGAVGDTQAHHDDYSRPLEVAWLCRICHRARHEAKEER